MNTLRRRGIAAGLLLLAALLLPTAALADRLHLDNGGEIVTDTWWIEGDWLHYRGAAGTVGIPRSMVLRIEETADDAATEPRDATASVETRATSAEIIDARTRIAEAHAALERRDFQAASDLYLEIFESHPDAHGARIGYALAEMSLGRDGIALSVILDGIARDPNRAEFHELLGDLRNREERVEDALREWNTAFGLDPTDRVREKVLKAQRELQAGGNYDLATSVHFTLRFDGEVDRTLAREVMEHLEEQYWRLAGRYRHAPPQPITVLLYPTREFREVTRSPEWVGGLYDGKIRVPIGGLSRLTTRAESVLTHELTHAVIHSKTRGHCPRWLHEGLAQIEDGRKPTPADAREVAKLFVDRRPEQWDVAGFSYPAALSLTHWLIDQRGFDGLMWVLDGLAEGQAIDAALRRTYGLDYAAVCERWAESAGSGGTR